MNKKINFIFILGFIFVGLFSFSPRTVSACIHTVELNAVGITYEIEVPQGEAFSIQAENSDGSYSTGGTGAGVLGTSTFACDDQDNPIITTQLTGKTGVIRFDNNGAIKSTSGAATGSITVTTTTVPPGITPMSQFSFPVFKEKDDFYYQIRYQIGPISLSNPIEEFPYYTCGHFQGGSCINQQILYSNYESYFNNYLLPILEGRSTGLPVSPQGGLPVFYRGPVDNSVMVSTFVPFGVGAQTADGSLFNGEPGLTTSAADVNLFNKDGIDFSSFSFLSPFQTSQVAYYYQTRKQHSIDSQHQNFEWTDWSPLNYFRQTIPPAPQTRWVTTWLKGELTGGIQGTCSTRAIRPSDTSFFSFAPSYTAQLPPIFGGGVVHYKNIGIYPSRNSTGASYTFVADCSTLKDLKDYLLLREGGPPSQGQGHLPSVGASQTLLAANNEEQRFLDMNNDMRAVIDQIQLELDGGTIDDPLEGIISHWSQFANIFSELKFFYGKYRPAVLNFNIIDGKAVPTFPSIPIVLLIDPFATGNVTEAELRNELLSKLPITSALGVKGEVVDQAPSPDFQEFSVDWDEVDDINGVDADSYTVLLSQEEPIFSDRPVNGVINYTFLGESYSAEEGLNESLFEQRGTVFLKQRLHDVKETQFTFDTLDPFQTYFYRILAVNENDVPYCKLEGNFSTQGLRVQKSVKDGRTFMHLIPVEDFTGDDNGGGGGGGIQSLFDGSLLSAATIISTPKIGPDLTGTFAECGFTPGFVPYAPEIEEIKIKIPGFTSSIKKTDTRPGIFDTKIGVDDAKNTADELLPIPPGATLGIGRTIAGPRVKLLESFAKLLGFSTGQKDTFDSTEGNLVRKIQKFKNEKQDGLVGKNTLISVNKEILKIKSALGSVKKGTRNIYLRTDNEYKIFNSELGVFENNR
ncbi:hypothetical protein COB64_02335 [Candidatus Wolfebacteria bacterium]|nr:MAG: hypothetical protein COB64_02335 [Candidatus Wolfebacteria bacterium]